MVNLNLFSRKKLHRAYGDQARDRKDWARAAAGYQRHLDRQPGDTAIRVQLGHALKEQNRLAEAEQAYRDAIRQAPDDLDATHHLAHLLKQTGQRAEAAEQFTRLFEQGGSREAFGELAQFLAKDMEGQVAAPHGRLAQGDALFIELDDLLHYLDAHKTVSGIQRVQLGVVQHVLATAGSRARVLFVLNEPGAPCLWQVRDTDIGAIAAYLQRPELDHAKLRVLVAGARQRATAVLAGQGHTYLVLGAFWGYGAIAPRYATMKRAGVRMGAYVYDLIPITHAEYCDEALPHEFKLSMGDGLAVFDFILAISEFSAAEVRRYIRKMRLPERPVVAVPLAHTTSETPEPAGTAMVSTPSPLDSLRGRPFAMMVSTIEARKNHGYLVAAWKTFLDEGLDPPDLVFVGRQGWRVSSLMELLATTRHLDGRVHILHDLSDAELTALYDACDFTLFPSFVEGWGLPVGESLARGKPCVASSTSSLPEVGGDLVDYLDPMNLRDGLEVIRRMAFDTAYRESRAAEIRARFKPRTWPDVSAHLLDQVDRLRRSVEPNTRPEVLLAPGTVFRIGELALGHRLPDSYARHPLRSMLVKGWYGIKPRGCWMQGHHGELLFRSDLSPGTDIVIYLGLFVAKSAGSGLNLQITVDRAGAGSTVCTPPSHGAFLHRLRDRVGKDFSLRVGGVVGTDGLVRIRLMLHGPVEARKKGLHSRRAALGLASVCYTQAGDAGAQMLMLERLILGDPHADDRTASLAQVSRLP